MEKILADIFAELEERGVHYTLRHGFEDLSEPSRSREVDLLVAPAHLPLLAGLLVENGYTEIPPWGHAPHHFFVIYNPDSDTWLKWDVVTDLRHGKLTRHLRVDIADHCLRNRRRRGMTYVPSAEDEFIMLLLHCLINKGAFQPAKQLRLRELRSGVDMRETAARMAERVDRYFAPAITWDQVLQAIDTGGWELLVKRRPRLVRQLFWREPWRTSWRYLSQRLRQRLRPVFFAFRRRGLTIALLAPDGAGKTTLARELTREPFLQARVIYMGMNVEASTVGLPTTKWLEKQLRSPNGHKKGRLALKVLRFSNRLAEQWLRYAIALYHKWRGRFVIFDRYIYDAWVNSPARSFRRRLRKWLFEIGCPTPDLVFLLDAPSDLLYQRKGEHTPEVLERQRRGYLSLYDQIPQMFVVDATREADEVRRTVVSMICDRDRVRAAKKKRNGHKDAAAR